LFSDLKDFTKTIAGDAGLNMTSDEAWRWFGTGGFIDHDTSGADVAGYALYATKHITANFVDGEADYHLFGKTHFQINLEGATETSGANAIGGRIHRHPCYSRDGKSIPMLGVCGWISHLLSEERTARQIIDVANQYRASLGLSKEEALGFPRHLVETMEAMILDGWITARTVEGHDGWPRFSLDYSRFLHPNRDVALRLDE
jgi:hypothetical protein